MKAVLFISGWILGYIGTLASTMRLYDKGKKLKESEGKWTKEEKKKSDEALAIVALWGTMLWLFFGCIMIAQSIAERYEKDECKES